MDAEMLSITLLIRGPQQFPAGCFLVVGLPPLRQVHDRTYFLKMQNILEKPPQVHAFLAGFNLESLRRTCCFHMLNHSHQTRLFSSTTAAFLVSNVGGKSF
jgi:hypothetical protein